MKKVFAVIVALILAFSLCVPAAAAGRGTTSGQMTPFFVDYDPQALSDLLGGFDISGIFNDLGFGDLGGILGGFDLGSLFGDLDLGSMLGDFDIGSIFGGDFDILGMIMDLFGGGGGGASPAPSTTAPTTSPTTSPIGTTGTVTPPSQTGDTSGVSMAIAVGVMAIAAAAFVCTYKKKED